MPRQLHVIASEIEADCKGKSFYPYAEPYVDAMKNLNWIADSYGYDSAESVVIYALSNLTYWRGEKARTIKAELNAILKEAK